MDTIHDNQIGIQRIIFVAFKSSLFGAVFQKPVDGFGFFPSNLSQTLGSSAGG